MTTVLILTIWLATPTGTGPKDVATMPHYPSVASCVEAGERAKLANPMVEYRCEEVGE